MLCQPEPFAASDVDQWQDTLEQAYPGINLETMMYERGKVPNHIEAFKILDEMAKRGSDALAEWDPVVLAWWQARRT